MKQLSYIFGSKSKAQEILLLQHDAKEVVRQGFYDHELPRVQKFCKDNSLHLEISKFKVLLADDTLFSNKGIRIKADDKREGMYFTYISKNHEKALLAAYFEIMNNSAELGKVLGYPACCIDFFNKNFSSTNTNLEHTPENAWTNITKRDKDLVILSHFPCSSTCEKSIQLAQSYVDVLMKVNKERVGELVEGLQVR